ncbi:MAG: helicase c2 [Gemmatimonadetes bacterium]|nr:helicase c2 [Gemmatimonadota bacterium]
MSAGGTSGRGLRGGPESNSASGLRLTTEAAARIRAEIERARGREVCFLATVTPDREVVDPRAVARGNREAVLAAARDAPEGCLMMHNHPLGGLQPSNADLEVAYRLYERGIGTAIVDNAATELYVVVEPPAPRQVERLDVDALEAFVAPGGALEAIHPRYEDRPAQRRLLRFVAERYNAGGVGIAEAGTGTGKSLAYLLPSVAWALKNGERTIISTNTINLQEQLAAKDLPLVRDLLGQPFQWALVKGRGNYVSIRRARLAAEGSELLFDDARGAELRALLEWLRMTEDGSLSDLPFQPTPEVWQEVESDTDVCLRARCPHFQECFYQRARREAAAAAVLIVNHHLLFADLALRRTAASFDGPGVLPGYRQVVLDEAHNLEDAATTHFGVEVTRLGLHRVLGRVDREGRGVLSAIHERLRAGRRGPVQGELLDRIETRVRPAAERARAQVPPFFEVLDALLTAAGQEVLRLEAPELCSLPGAERLLGPLTAIVAGLAAVRNELAELRTRIELDEEWYGELEGRVLDLRSLENRLAAALGALRLVLTPGDDAAAYVRWIERRPGPSGRRENLAIAAAPVEVGPILRESFFERVNTAVLTSATLTVRKSFHFLKERLGLVDAELRVEEALFPSPFDWASQTRLCVPTDFPAARGPTEPFDQATANAVADVAEVTGGGVFVLFTSHRALRRVAELLEACGASRHWPLFVQGTGPRVRLVDQFTRAGCGVLLGTTSFWEGVDVPGYPLRALILQKLPFRVPTEPVVEARVQAIEAKGRSAFWSYVVPLAAIRLKQGFGRLVRSAADRGAVVLLDDRILRRRYGRVFLDSLPEAPLVRAPWARIREALRTFYLPGR